MGRVEEERFPEHGRWLKGALVTGTGDRGKMTGGGRRMNLESGHVGMKGRRGGWSGSHSAIFCLVTLDKSLTPSGSWLI